MQVHPCSSRISYGARMNDKTRTLIQILDKEYKQNLEYQVDNVISQSELADFCGDDATISFVETENPHCNIAPVISLNINGIVATHVLKGASSVCEEQDEEFLLEKMQRRPYRYINTISNRLNSESLSQIKKALAIDYLNRINADFNSEEVDDRTFDKLKA